ncbi:MAG TPA: maleylacetoacetate isomerase [Steroidobacteraceae bacterium]|nr:maleylacetoacetate isomerase [Steroidobacteraceae bacterium]
MKLYSYFRSSAAYRVRIALAVKGITYETLPVNLRLAGGEHRQPGYLARNPAGLVPALDTGAAVLAQSLAIIEYLEETVPTPALLPEGALERAQVRGLALSVACDIHPLNNLRVLEYLRGPLAQPPAAVQTWYEHWIGTGLAALEVLARRHSASSRFLYGDRLTIADVCLVPQLWNARRFHCDVAPYPTLVAVDAYLAALAAVQAARPEVQPDMQA